MIVELPNMARKDKVFNFIIGLKPWAHNELKRQNIKTLEEAFATVDRLVDHLEERVKDRKKQLDKPREKASKEDEVRACGKMKVK